MRSFFRDEFHEFTPNDPTTDSSFWQFVTIRVISVSVAIVSCAFSVAIYSVSADTILLKSAETLKGQITSESDLSVTISTETLTGKTDKTIASEIVGLTLTSPAENKPEAAQSPSEESSSKSGVTPDAEGFYGVPDAVIDDPDGYVNLRKEKNADSPIIAKVKKDEPFEYRCTQNATWCKVKLASGVTGWMHYSRIKRYYTEKDLPKGPEDSGEEIDEQTRKHGVNYYEVTRAAARGDKKALKTFFTLGLDGAAEETHITSILPVVIHLVGDDALAGFLRNQPLNFQFTVRNKLDDNVTYPFRSLEYLQLHFPKTSKLFFRREIYFPSPDGHYTIHKVFSDEQPTEDSKVTRSQLIDKGTGKVVKDLTAEDEGRWLYREGDVEWAPDSKGFLYFGEGPIKPEAYQLSGKSFVNIEVPSLDHMPLSGCDPKLGNAYPGLEKIHWSKPGTLVCKKTCYHKSTDKSGTDHELQRTYEITMTIGPDGKLTTEEKPVENNEY